MPPIFSHMAGFNLDVLSLVEACAMCAPSELQMTMVNECLRQLEVEHFATVTHMAGITGVPLEDLQARVSNLDKVIDRFRGLKATLTQTQGGPQHGR